MRRVDMKFSNSPHAGCQDQLGFTLIEALIALLVLSLGLLGVGAMQLKALQSAHIGYQRAVASLMAVDAQERAWERFNIDGLCPDSDVLESGWINHWEGVGVLRNLQVSGTSWTGGGLSDDCVYQIFILWNEERLLEFRDDDGDVDISEDFNVFVYEFNLPGI